MVACPPACFFAASLQKAITHSDYLVWQYVTFESNPRLDQKSTTLTIASFTLLTMTVNTNRIGNSNRITDNNLSTIEWKVERADDETVWTYHGMNQRMYGLGNKKTIECTNGNIYKENEPITAGLLIRRYQELMI
ncbi:hypothetical protein GQX74_013254 [Glossina fuscipes]|nr:hypothetical protein GQX74_013254 [Glossina fuscipes]